MTRASVLIILCLLRFSTQRSTPEDDSYVAAVVEYQVQANSPQNLENYSNLIKDAGNQEADIVVFPELTLSVGRSVVVPILDKLTEYPVPALNPEFYDEVLVTISNAARQNAIYVVINIQELVDCREPSNEYCPEEKIYLFNTNVVFDRNGAVIDRYRKINLFGEFTRTPALRPDLGIFSTDFGVTFGHFICFDLMFQVPAVQLVDKHNLTDIIFPTMWFSEMPYLTAVQIQEAYAYSLDVNFLAAGANNVNIGSAGSGIYSGEAGALISIMPGTPTTRLLVARVPKVPGRVTGTYPGPIYDNPSVLDNLKLISDPSLPSHNSKLLSPGFQEITLTESNVVCRFRVRLSQTSNETSAYYRAFVQDGKNTYARRDVGVAACLMVACKTEDAKSCPYRFGKNEEAFEVEELEIKMTSYRKRMNSTLDCSDVEYFPVSMRNNKFPLSPTNFTFSESSKNNEISLENNEVTENGGNVHFVYKINSPQTDLISFGLWGRIYDRDGKNIQTVNKEDIGNFVEIEDIIYGYKRKVSTS